MKKSSQNCDWPQIWPPTRPQFNNYRGIAQLVARDIWDVEAGSSSLPTPTTILAESRGSASTFGRFLCIFKHCDATFGKSIFLRPLIKCGLRKILFFDYCDSNFESPLSVNCLFDPCYIPITLSVVCIIVCRNVRSVIFYTVGAFAFIHIGIVINYNDF